MARGEDTSRHPRRQVGRLAHLMSAQANRYWQQIPGETPEVTQGALDMYRSNRDTLGSDNRHVQRDAKVIGSAFKNRHNDSYGQPL